MWFVDNIEAVYQRKDIAITSPLQGHPPWHREFAFTGINGYYIRVAEPQLNNITWPSSL